MKLPPDSIVAREKLTHYLLRPRDDHDKSGFLSFPTIRVCLGKKPDQPRGRKGTRPR